MNFFIKNNIYNTKFKTQLIIFFTIVISMVTSLILVGLYLIQWRNYSEQARETLENQAVQIALNIDNKINYYLSFANQLVLDKNLISMLERDDFTSAENMIKQETDKMINLNAGKISEIKILHISKDSVNEKEQLVNQLIKNTKTGSDLIWTGTYLNERNQKVFSFFQKIYQTNLNQEYYVEVSIYETELLTFFNKDNSGYIISVKNSDKLMSTSDRAYFNSIIRNQKITSQDYPQNINEIKGKTINVSAKCKIGWDVNIYADISHISKSFFEGFFRIIPIILITIILAFMYITVISKRLSKRMNILLKKIGYISQLDFTNDLGIQGNDEFKVLSNALDETRNRIINLIAQINKTNRLKRIAEMTALRSQINSHFLFNSLSTIKWLSRHNNKNVLIEAVEKLSYILKYSLSLDENYVPLSIEIEYLKAFIYLEKLRYHDAVMLHIDIDEALLSTKTVKHILQPLVENSIYHGRREDGSTLNITIYSYSNEDSYDLVVEDDGNGMTEEKIFEILHREYKDVDESYGLINVINRIRICTGDTGTLTIESKPMSFTKITINQPKM